MPCLLNTPTIAPDVLLDENVYGVDDDDDDDEENVDEAVAEHYRVLCDPIVYPLNPHNLTLFKLNVQPLSMATPTADLEECYYSTLRYAN